MRHEISEEYKPVLKIWNYENGLYWAEHDAFMEVVINCPYSTLEIKERLHNAYERYQEAMYGKSVDWLTVRTIEVSLGAFIPPWQKAFRR